MQILVPSITFFSCFFGQSRTHFVVILKESSSMEYPGKHLSHSANDELHEAHRLSEHAETNAKLFFVKPK